MSLDSQRSHQAVLNTPPSGENMSEESMSEYVAHLQLHMSLQAKKLVPDLHQTQGSRAELLQQTQATFEKHVSRQGR